MIQRAIERAYRVAKERGWDRVYWALDLHGTCIESNYKSNEYGWINESCRDVLRELAAYPETNLILWSSLHQADKIGVSQFFESEGIRVVGINHNPFEANTATGNFDEKFYMSIIVDDKAGFDPVDWELVGDSVRMCRAKYGF